MSHMLNFYYYYEAEICYTLITLTMSLFVFMCNKLTKKANFLCFMQYLTAGIAIMFYLTAVIDDGWAALYGLLFTFISGIMFFIIVLLSLPTMRRLYIETWYKIYHPTETNDKNEVKYPTYEEVYGTKDNTEMPNSSSDNNNY